MDAEGALKMWGASKLPKTAHVWNKDGMVEVPVAIDLDTVSVVFEFEKGYECCGGTDPDCYCSMAEPAMAEVSITGYGVTADNNRYPLTTTIQPSKFDFGQVIREMVALTGPIT